MNGAGKTTLLSWLLPDGRRRMGSLFWQGGRVADRHSFAALRKQFGYLPQEKVLPRAWKVSDYLLFAARARGVQASDLHDAVTTASDVLNVGGDLAKRRIGTLSGGWQRRVHITQALLAEPSLLILDEPFNALDHRAVELLREHISAYVKQPGRVVLVADHTSGLLDVPHNAIHLANGRVA